MKLEDLKNKKVLILGFGREGKDTLLFLKKKFPHQKFGIADQTLDKNYLKVIKNYDIVIKSPGIPTWKIAPFLKKGQKVTSQTNIFFENCPGTIIGVTGTKGKSTTSSLIYEVLKNAGLKAYLIGNIEKPVLQFLNKATKKDIFVYELSSFQLEYLTQSPHIAVLLNIYPEHLDHHGTLKNYAKAKANIALHQKETDFLIYNKTDPLVETMATQSKAQKIPFVPHLGTKSLSSGFVASTEPAKIIGKLFNVPQETIERAIKNFKPLPHRLEKIGEYKGITFYNDSLATIPEATIQAINMLGPKLHTLIAGGFDRGVPFKELGKHIEQSGIKTLILFPTTGEKILQAICLKRDIKHFFAENMKDAVRLAYQHTPAQTICLLSPASSSFNMFKNYKDRGDQFKKFVAIYGKKA